MIFTTLNRIRAHNPCKTGWVKLLRYLGKTEADDELLSFKAILRSNGLHDALWACRVEPEVKWRKLAVEFCLPILYLLEDNHSVKVLEVAWLHAEGKATDEELKVAWDAAWDAAGYAAAACAAAGDAARAARDAAMDVSWEAARYAARAARDATRNATQQEKIFLDFVILTNFIRNN